MIYNISSLYLVRHETLLDGIKEKRELWYTVKGKKRDKTIGHIPRHDSLLKRVTEGDVEGHVGRGGPRKDYTKRITIGDGEEYSYNLRTVRIDFK